MPTEIDMSALLTLDKATVYRGYRPVFSRLDLTIPAGRHTAILGPNGSGKSTMLKLLTRELYPLADDGRVTVLGRERWNVWDLRAHLGLLSHDLQHDYPGHVSGIEVVLTGFFSSAGIWDHLPVTPSQQQRALDLMTTLGITHLAARPYASMSTGEQRRCLLARALVHDPDTLVLDEPTAGLDLKACFQYLDLVRNLMRTGTTVVVVTHHIHEIPPEVGYVVLLKNGAVFAEGPRSATLEAGVLSQLFDTPVGTVEWNGYVHAVPRE